MLENTKSTNQRQNYLKKAFYVKLDREEHTDDLVKSPKKIIQFSSETSVGSKEIFCSVCHKMKKQTSYKKMEKDLRSLAYNVRKINKQKHIISIMRRLHEREHKLIVHLNKSNIPEFRVISKLDLKGNYIIFDFKPKLLTVCRLR